MKKLNSFFEQSSPSRRAFLKRTLVAGCVTVLAVPASYLIAQVIDPTKGDHMLKNKRTHGGQCEQSTTSEEKVSSTSPSLPQTKCLKGFHRIACRTDHPRG